MPKNKIEDLRNHLFETLEALKDTENPMELDRAKAIAAVSKVIVESAKVEVSFLKEVGGLKSTGFLPVETAETGETQRPRPKLAAGR